MSAPVLPGLAGDDEWPEVTPLGGDQVDQVPAEAAPASPPVAEPAGPGVAVVDDRAEVVGRRSPVHAGKPPVGTGKETSAPGAPGAHDVCRSPRCRQKIRWAKTDTGDAIPVDYAPDPQGRLVRYMRAPGDWRVRVLKKDEQADPTASRWTSHFTSCPEATRFRTRDRAAAAKAGPGPRPPLAAVPTVPRRLLAVDGNSLGHRAFHAYERSNMRHSDGRPWWAVYGFMALLLGVIDKVGPDAVLVGFDDRAASARRNRYPDYKAGRSQRSPDLYAQLDLLPDLLGELGVATMIPPALEADDVLASAAAAATAAGWRCTIATSDKDAFRLVSDTTTVLRLVNGLDNAVTVTPAVLEGKYGVTPAQYGDFCVLVGDKSDNLPGVSGIGPVKAARLLHDCGTLNGALADPATAATAIGKAYAGKLHAAGAAEAIARNRDLMALEGGLPVNPDACTPRRTGGEVARVLKAWQVPSLIDRAVVALARPTPVADARLVPVPAPVARPAVPVTVPRSLLAPPVEVLGADQDETDRTCGLCGTVCGARVPVLGKAGETVLLAGAALLGDVVLVRDGEGWAAEPIAGYGGNVDNRRTVHRCTIYPGRCVTPGHADRPARPYPGGYFCDPCNTNRRR